MAVIHRFVSSGLRLKGWQAAFAAAVVVASGECGPLQAQTFDSTLLINTTLPPDFDRGRNVSVTERSRPDYDPLGIRAGGFEIFPRLGVAGGYTDNTYLTSQNERGSAIISVAPSVEAHSDWSVHEVRLVASGVFDQYLGNSPRNQDNWTINALGRLDARADMAVTGEAHVSRIYESPLSGDIQSNLTVLSSYLQTYGNLRVQQTFGRLRGMAAVDYTKLDFSDLTLQDGTGRSQADRNRGLVRGTGQLEYGLSPSASVYGQFTYINTDYDRSLLDGSPNRDSGSFRLLGGMTLDLAGLVRGQAGLGYSHIGYRSPLYRDVGGFSAEAQLQYFPSELTTFTLRAGRSFQDANFGSLSAYVDSRLSLRADHELLTNLLLDIDVDAARQSYVDSTLRSTSYRVLGGGRYLMSRFAELNASLSYLSRSSDGGYLGQNFNELRLSAGIVLHR
jgi:hypothetical protein